MKRISMFLIVSALVAAMVGWAADAYLAPDSDLPPSDCVEIRHWHGLDLIRENLTRSHVLTNDLDVTIAGCVEPMSPTPRDRKESQPIGDLRADPVVRDMVEPANPNDTGENPLVVPVTSNLSDLASLPGWYWVASYDNYAPSGMPDFDQRQQDGWSGFCGPTAVANCLWWLDSKYADLAGVPGDGNDTFPLARDYGDALPPVPGPNWDDHNFNNVNDPTTPWPPEGPPPTTPAFAPGPQPQPSGMPAWGELVERLAWYVDCNGIRGGWDFVGTYRHEMLPGIRRWLEEEGLDHILGVTSVSEPDFYFIAETVERGDCVMLSIGWWDEEEPGVWKRASGHFVTVAGVNSDEPLIALSDPGFDQTPPTNSQEHNDVAIASHDIWPVDLDCPRPDGTWWLQDYATELAASFGLYVISQAVVEHAVIISPIPPSVTAQAASAIGTTSVSLNMSYTHGDQTTVDLRFAYKKAADADWTEAPWVSASIPWIFLSEEGTHQETLIGLDSNTAYEFKAELRYDETVIDGDVFTFNTEKMEPIVTTEEATDITTDSAILNMTFMIGDYGPVEVRFNWREDGTDVWTETTWTSQASDGTHIEVLSELDHTIVYEFKAQLIYDHAASVIEGTVSTFTTKEKGRCFIATAAYCTPMAEEVRILREFRDGCLLTNSVGQAFVDFYYRTSPPIAEFLDEHPALKPIVRVGLTPAVAMSTVVVNTPATEKIIAVSLLILVSVTLVAWAARRRGRGSECTLG